MKTMTWQMVQERIALGERGYGEPEFEVTPNGVIATAHKGEHKVQAIGQTKKVAVAQLVKVVTR